MSASRSTPDELNKFNHFPDHLSHRDLRSYTHATNRLRKQSQKYYGYRGVHPSWINQPCFRLTLSAHNKPTTLSKTPLSTTNHVMQWTSTALTTIALSEVAPNQRATSHTSRTLASLADSMNIPETQTLKVIPSQWTRRDTYQHKENGIWPLDVRHHRGKKIREKKAQKWDLKFLGKRGKQRAARARDPVREYEVEDGVWQRCYEDFLEWHYRVRVEYDSAVANARDWQRDETTESVALSGPAEMEISLEDFEDISDLDSVVGDDETWEFVSAWDSGDG